MFSSGPMTPGGGISGAGSPWDERPTKVGVSGRSPGSIASEFSPAKESVLGTPAKIKSLEDPNVNEIFKIGNLEELVTSFVFTSDPDHDELVTESPDVVSATIATTGVLSDKILSLMQAAKSKTVVKSISYSVSSDSELDPVVKSLDARAKMAVVDVFAECMGVVKIVIGHSNHVSTDTVKILTVI